MDMVFEYWIAVPDFIGRYSISSLGRVRSLVTTRGKLRKIPLILQPQDRGRGYLQVRLYLGKNKYKVFYVHRLMAQSFLENPKNKPEVNHKDGDSSNNKLYNLEWVTKLENHEHACKNDFQSHKLKNQDIESIKNLFTTGKYSYGDLAQMFGIDRSYIGRIISGKRKRHGSNI